jgi:hypothetical protein
MWGSRPSSSRQYSSANMIVITRLTSGSPFASLTVTIDLERPKVMLFHRRQLPSRYAQLLHRQPSLSRRVGLWMVADRCFGGSTGRGSRAQWRPEQQTGSPSVRAARDQPDVCRIFLAPAELAGVSQRPAIWPQRIACLEPTYPILVECTRDQSVQHNEGDC